jgi:putative ABC transport system substrate-binding protein
MKRREFITLLGGAAAAWPLAARAQQPERMRRVGLLSTFAESDPEAQSMVGALDQALHELGWVEGRNLRIDRRWAAGNPGRLDGFAKVLIALEPDVIVAHGTPAVSALRKQTRSIPIVFVQVTDPFGSGFVVSYAQPGGNITGFTTFEPSMVGKWGEMLKEIAPGISRIAFLFNPETAPYIIRYFQGPLETSARSLGMQPSSNPVHNTSEIESAITALARAPGGGLIIMPDTFNIVHRELIIRLAGQNKLPAISPYRFVVAEGGLISYGIDLVGLFRRTGGYVDRILRGAKPAELPVQAPTKFELVINLKTAKALGLDVPLYIQQLADEVIE